MKKFITLFEKLNQEAIAESAIIEALPDSLREIIKKIPLQCVLKLIDEFGGTSIHVPTNHNDSALAKCIGSEAAEQLVAIYSGDRIAVPRAARLLRLIRDREIIRLRLQGVSVHELSKKFGLTERHIYIIQESNRSLIEKT